MKIIFLVLLLSVLGICKSARILGVFPVPGKSHYILGSALMRALAEKGHDVTVISPFGEKDPPKGGKYRDIILKEMMEELEERRRTQSLNMFEIGDMTPFINIPFIAHLMSDLGHIVLKEAAVQNLINSAEEFDVVIIEQFFNDAHKVLASHFKGVQVLFNPITANYWVNPLVGNPSPLSYIPDTMLSYSSHMTFPERLMNFLVYLLNVGVHFLYLFPKHNAAAQQNIPNAPQLNQVLYNASIVLLNSHASMNAPVPHVPCMVEIGGFHVKPPKKLPQDLQEFLDSAKDGVIYFSMGSNLKSAELPADKREAFLKVFAKLKQKVLWKWEDDVLPGQPPNVKLGKWLPQQDILAHPNVKLFITHGGLLSTTETIYHGVPILAIPVYGDQKLNAQNAVTSGFGLSLSFKDVSETTLSEKLHELINNPRYAVNAKQKSDIFHDRQVKPMDTAIYWIEYAIRHKGASHLRVAGVDLPWYQYHLLDVIAVILLAVIIAIVVTALALKKICLRRRTKTEKRKVKKS